MANRRFSQQGSRKIPDQLDPELANLCSQPSPVIRSRIDSLAEQARNLSIHPNRVVKYAFLHATAERQAQGDTVSEEHTRRSIAELAGGLSGFPEGYWHPAKAMRLYRRSRRSRQLIQASIEGVLMKWTAVVQVVRMHRLHVPKHQQARLSDERLDHVRKRILDMARAVILDEELPSDKNRSREPRVTEQTYIWWHFSIARYNGKTNEMYQLAKVWKLTAAKDVETFRRMVIQACRGAKSMRFPIGSAWESVLSKTP